MFPFFRKILALVISLVLLLSAAPLVRAEESQAAREITSAALVTDMVGLEDCAGLFDGDTAKVVDLPERSRLTLTAPEGIGSIYIQFDMEYGPCSVTDRETGMTCWFGQNQFLHDFWDLEAAFGTAPASVDIRFARGDAQVLEMQVFTPGQVPENIQKWTLPKENATDLILFSTHGDDEQLFFAGLLPYYAGELDYEVLVVYLTSHLRQTTVRRHEMLNGLWAVGVEAYPVFGPFSDLYPESAYDSYLAHANRGESKKSLQAFVLEQVRRYKPLVAVGHDLRMGEYGHGQHMMYADLLCFAAKNAGNPEVFPDSAGQFGTWDIPKTYLHLWPKNEIIMDWDQPLSSFDGMTAYQVTKHLGFPQHVSQQGNFLWYLYDKERSDEIIRMSPREYGLYHTTVGQDEAKNDMFEHLTPYAMQEMAGNP